MTAFNIHSYELLRPDLLDRTNTILARMSAPQFGNFSSHLSFADSSQHTFEEPSNLQSFKPPSYAILLNILWFTGLAVCLFSAIIGLLVKQWLKEFTAGLYGTSREIARIRQLRLRNLEKWHISSMVAIIPVLLITSILFLLAGLLVTLHQIDQKITIVVSIFVSIFILFLAITTVLPTVSRSCCYYSPQAYAFFSVQRGILQGAKNFLRLSSVNRLLAFGHFKRATSLGHCDGVSEAYWENDASPRVQPRMWKQDEHKLSTEQSANLDISILSTAYSVTLDPTSLDTSTVCLSDIADHSLLPRYLACVDDTLRCHYGTQDCWPASIQAQLDASARESLTLALKGYGANNNTPPLKYRDEIEKYLKIPGLSRDEYTRLKAFLSICEDIGSTEADNIWKQLCEDNDICEIRNIETYKTGSWRHYWDPVKHINNDFLSGSSSCAQNAFGCAISTYQLIATIELSHSVELRSCCCIIPVRHSEIVEEPPQNRRSPIYPKIRPRHIPLREKTIHNHGLGRFRQESRDSWIQVDPGCYRRNS